MISCFSSADAGEIKKHTCKKVTDLIQNGQIEKKRRAVIEATGSAVPAKVLDNAELEKMVDTSDEWITVRTGIKERRIAALKKGETTASLSVDAVRKLFAGTDLREEDLDVIICATITPEMVFPATACFIQKELNNRTCAAFDISAACSGYTYGISIASSFIESGQCDQVLVVGAETLSRITNYRDRSSCILFGDGAGAILLRAEENTDRGVLYSEIHADGADWETLSCQAFGSRYPYGTDLPHPDAMYMDIRGRETYQLAVRRIIELVERVYRKHGIGSEDIKMIVPHQMNARIIESVIKRLKLPEDKVFVNIHKYGNTSAASIAIALDEAFHQNHFEKGDLIILVSFGGGLTWGINLIRV